MIKIYFNVLKCKVNFFLISLSYIVLVFPGRHKPTTLDKKGVDLPNNLVPSASASRMHELKGKGVTVKDRPVM